MLVLETRADVAWAANFEIDCASAIFVQSFYASTVMNLFPDKKQTPWGVGPKTVFVPKRKTQTGILLMLMSGAVVNSK